MNQSSHHDIIDLFVIGGGINGCGIARDAVGRGLTVELAEMNDLASATSSASTKLFHGGLRYLEYWEMNNQKQMRVSKMVFWSILSIQNPRFGRKKVFQRSYYQVITVKLKTGVYHNQRL